MIFCNRAHIAAWRMVCLTRAMATAFHRDGIVRCKSHGRLTDVAPEWRECLPCDTGMRTAGLCRADAPEPLRSEQSAGSGCMARVARGRRGRLGQNQGRAMRGRPQSCGHGQTMSVAGQGLRCAVSTVRVGCAPQAMKSEPCRRCRDACVRWATEQTVLPGCRQFWCFACSRPQN